MDYKKTDKYKRAQKKLTDLKSFYTHFLVYIIVNVIIIGSFFMRLYVKAGSISDLDFERWLTFNTFSVAFFWGIGLAYHALKVFDFRIFKSWEERKVKELLEKENSTNEDLNF